MLVENIEMSTNLYDYTYLRFSNKVNGIVRLNYKEHQQNL